MWLQDAYVAWSAVNLVTSAGLCDEFSKVVVRSNVPNREKQPQEKSQCETLSWRRKKVERRFMSSSSIEIFTEAFVLFMVKWKLFQTSTTRLMTHTGRNVKLDRTNPNIRHICSFVKYIFTRNYLTRISGDKRSGSRQCIMWSREWCKRSYQFLGWM